MSWALEEQGPIASFCRLCKNKMPNFDCQVSDKFNVVTQKDSVDNACAGTMYEDAEAARMSIGLGEGALCKSPTKSVRTR